MKKTEQQRYDELKEQNRILLRENVDLKLENEKLKSRIQALECVASLLERSGMR
jgi:regulator of replication initiation timing